METHLGMDIAQKMAIFRFSLIAPVLQGTLSEPSAMAYYRRVTENPLTRPDGSQFQYNPKTLEKWTAAYKKGGLPALTPKERSDKGAVRVISSQATAEIFHIKEMFPRLGAVQIRLRLIEKALITADVSERTIQRFLKNNRLKFQTGGVGKDRKAFEASAFGELWQADTCHFPYIKEGGVKRRTYLMCIIDDHSRLIVGARLYYNDSALNFQTLLKSSVATYGIPQKLYLDNGSAYNNSQLSFICASLGCLLLHAPVRDGAAKAKIERTFGTLKTRWLAGMDASQIESLEQFNSALSEHIRAHNLMLNSSTEATPMDRYLQSPNSAQTPKSREWLEHSFMNRITRKVKNDATVHFYKTSFDAPMHFIGQTVDIRFLPDRLSDAYILKDNLHFPLRLTNKEENARTKRKKLPAVDYSQFEGDQHV